MDFMKNLQPSVSDRDLFTGALHSSATDAFMTIGPAKLKAEHGGFGPYFHYLRDSSGTSPS